jgi:hypothetical protein
MDTKMVYIAGPMRGRVYYNWDAFHKESTLYRLEGFAVINPHEQDLEAGFDVHSLPWDRDWDSYPPGFDKDACYKRCIEAVKRCDLIHMLEGWEKSTGASAEHALAKWMGKEIEYATEPRPIPEPADKGSKATNPKDAIGCGKLPLHLWPSTATMMGCVGLLNGMLKYGRSNWRKAGVRASIYYDALHRHMDAWFEGEDVDPDDNVPHLSAALACLAIIVDAQAAGMLNDDRMVPGGYRGLRDGLTPAVNELKEHHADKNPKHWTIEDK